MTITYELDLYDFKAWSGAKATLERIIKEGKCEEVEDLLDENYPDGLTETELNDLLWFENEWIFEAVGIRSYDKVKAELNEAKEEFNDLVNQMTDELADDELTDEEMQDIRDEYIPDIDELRERITQLEEELKEL